MKTKIAHRTRKEPKKLDLRSLFGKAESSFQKTCLVDCAELFVAVGERSAELLTELQAMQRILRRVTETEIIPVERRRVGPQRLAAVAQQFRRQVLEQPHFRQLVKGAL